MVGAEWENRYLHDALLRAAAPYKSTAKRGDEYRAQRDLAV